MKRILTILSIFLIGSCLHKTLAQDYKYEIGVEAGISSYWGDANQTSIIYRPGFTGGAIFRYVIDYRWAIRANLSAAMLSGNTADRNNIFPGGGEYSFNTTLFDAGCRAEFNFLNYGIGYAYKNTSRISPYITAGLAFCAGFPEGNNFFTVNIPFGIGAKYKVAERWNLGLEFAMHKVLGDRIDSQDLKDPYKIPSSALKNTDWFSTLVFTITYDFGFKTLPCNTCPDDY
ncbi:MAG: outer membrane beta-barrel protein [Bacteroidaceae bacterium]|nr:outer membrane beta-barrel protein [Bacteroidaceae bacterium]